MVITKKKKYRNHYLIIIFLVVIISCASLYFYSYLIRSPPRLLLEDDFENVTLSENTWSFFTNKGFAKFKDGFLHLEWNDGHTLTPLEGVTIFSKRNDLDNGVLEFDFNNAETVPYTYGNPVAVVVNFNQNDEMLQSEFYRDNGHYNNTWGSSVCYRIRFDILKDYVEIQVYNHTTRPIETKGIKSPIDILNKGHLKIIKNGKYFEFYFNETYIGGINIVSRLPSNRIGFSVGCGVPLGGPCIDAGFIDIDNVKFYEEGFKLP